MTRSSQSTQILAFSTVDTTRATLEITELGTSKTENDSNLDSSKDPLQEQLLHCLQVTDSSLENIHLFREIEEGYLFLGIFGNKKWMTIAE